MGCLRRSRERGRRARRGRRPRCRRARVRDRVLLCVAREAWSAPDRSRRDAGSARERPPLHGRDRDRVSARGGQRGGRAPPGRVIRPRALRARREHLVRSVPVDPRGCTVASRGRQARLRALDAVCRCALPGRRRSLTGAAAAVLRDARAAVDAGGRDRVPAHLRRLDRRLAQRPASRSSGSSSSRRPKARAGTSTTTTGIRSGAGSGRARRSGSPASPGDARRRHRRVLVHRPSHRGSAARARTRRSYAHTAPGAGRPSVGRERRGAAVRLRRLARREPARGGHAVQHVLGPLRARRDDVRARDREHPPPLRRGEARGRAAGLSTSASRIVEPDSPFPYFRGKAATEQALRESGLSHAIVRPTLVFGPEDILVNNIAWALRRVPVFFLGTGERRGAAGVRTRRREDLRRGGGGDGRHCGRRRRARSATRSPTSSG